MNHKSEESKRLTYSAFFTDKYVSSRYSAIVDRCGEQYGQQALHRARRVALRRDALGEDASCMLQRV
jgi:hypothetical protein